MTGKLQGRLQRQLDKMVDQKAPATEPDPAEVTASNEEQPPTRPLPARPNGPRDSTEIDTVTGYYSVGPLFLPARTDITTRVDLDENENPTGITLRHESGSMQLEVFAAPRTEGTWDALAQQVASSLTAQGAEVEVVDGPFGPQVRAAVRTGAASGAQLRIIGIDGPRWLLRATVRSELTAPEPGATADDANIPAPGEQQTSDALGVVPEDDHDHVVEDGIDEVVGEPEPVPLADLVDSLEDVDGLPAGPLGELLLAAIVRRGTDPRPTRALLPLVIDPRLMGKAGALDVNEEPAVNRFAHLPGMWD